MKKNIVYKMILHFLIFSIFSMSVVSGLYWSPHEYRRCRQGHLLPAVPVHRSRLLCGGDPPLSLLPPVPQH